MNQDALAIRLRDEVNWDHFFSLVHAIGKDLNGRKYRFIKSDLLEMAIEAYGKGAIKWIDGEGWDHELDGHVKLEMKYSTGALYTATSRLKSHVKEIKMQNTLGGGKTRTLEDTFDYLLLADLRSAAVVAIEEVRKAIVPVDDGVKIGSRRLALASLSFIVRPSEVVIRDVEMPPILELLKKQYRAYVDRLGSGYDAIV
jgi:hypothetical protein